MGRFPPRLHGAIVGAMRKPAYEDRFFELLRRAEDESYAPTTGPLLEEAFRLADENADPEYGLLARYFYVFAVAPIEPHNAVVAFTWCIAHEQHASDLIPVRSLVHLYGIIAGILRSYPDYSLDQIEKTFLEMERKFQELMLPMRDVWHHRLYGALGIGDRERAAEYFERWSVAQPAPRGCPVCDLGTRVLYHYYLEEYDEGFRCARPIWHGLRCDDGQPLMAAAASLVPLLRVGELERARQCYHQARLELGVISYAGIWAAGRELAYLASVADVEEAIRSFERYFPVAWSSGTPADRFGYLLSCTLLARRLEEEGGPVELALPPACDAFREDGRYDPAELTAYFARRVERLGGRFDERNGNGEYMRIASLTDAIFRDVRASQS